MSKRIYRSSRARKIGGVCGGLAENFNIDPTIDSLIWAILAIEYGTGILDYIVAWINIPEDPYR